MKMANGVHKKVHSALFKCCRQTSGKVLMLPAKFYSIAISAQANNRRVRCQFSVYKLLKSQTSQSFKAT